MPRKESPPTIPPYASDTTWSCLPTNPSCARDPWWLERTEAGDSAQVTYQAIGPGFRSERSFAEAVNLVWQWPEGKDLLRQAERAGVGVVSLAYDRQRTFASFVPQRKTITVNQRYVSAPTWMLADVLAHELAHTAEPATADDMRASRSDCLASEVRAFGVEQRFLVWLTRSLVPSGLPALEVVSAPLSAEHVTLAQQLYRVGFSLDLSGLVAEIYADAC